jgi:hypothetical protein
MTIGEVAQRIRGGLECGQLTRRRAEILLGFMVLETVQPNVDPMRSTYFRHCSALRSLGLVSGSCPVEPVEVLL